MIYLIGAIALSLVSVRALNQGHKIYVEQQGPVTRVVAIFYTCIGAGSAYFSYLAVKEFLGAMGW